LYFRFLPAGEGSFCLASGIQSKNLFKQAGTQSVQENTCAELAWACIFHVLFYFGEGYHAYRKIVFKYVL